MEAEQTEQKKGNKRRRRLLLKQVSVDQPDRYKGVRLAPISGKYHALSPAGSRKAGGATDAQTPTPPAACDRNALSAL